MEQKQRTRTSISPLGLNNATPDNVVEDGALSVCHNLRFANGAWRNVQEFNAEDIPATLKGKDILYIHPVSGKKNYITKESTTVKETRVKYYGMRSQLMSATPKSTSQSPNIGVINKPIAGILDSVSETYYLDKPLREAQSNPYSATLYDKDLKKLGLVTDFDKGTLSYEAVDANAHNGVISIWYAQTTYFKLGVKLIDTFYFIVPEISAEAGRNDVFVKRGDTYLHFGTITNVDADNKTYAVKERESGITIACSLHEIRQSQIRFPYRIEEIDIFYFDFIDGGLLMRDLGSTHSIGYFWGVCNGGDSGSSVIKFSYDENDEMVYHYLNVNDEEKILARKPSESDEVYTARYLETIKPEDQIWGTKMSANIQYRNPLGGECRILYSWELESPNPYSTLTSFYGEPSLDITEEVEVDNQTTLIAWDSNGNKLNSFGLFRNDFGLDHFGNIIEVRDKADKSLSFFLFSEDKYRPYGNTGKTKVSFEVEMGDSILSPEITDVPMFYQAAGIYGGDGSLEGHMFLGAGEPALAIDTANLDGLNEGGNLLLIDNHNGYFRGELALFVVARAEDGTEIYKTPPQIVRTETLMRANTAVCLFNPSTMAIEQEHGDKAFDVDRYPYTYLIWARKHWDKVVGVDKTSEPSYKRWDLWKSRHKRYEEQIKPFLDGKEEGSSKDVRFSQLYKLNLSITSSGENIHEYAIYSTRLCPLFVFENGAIRTNPVDIINEPFYEMKVLTSDEVAYTITAHDIINIETKTDKVYKSTQSAEDAFYSAKGIEYNNRYHAYDIEVLAPPVSTQLLGNDTDNGLTHMVTSRLYNNAKVFASYGVGVLLADNNLQYINPDQLFCITFDEAIKDVYFGKLSADGKTISARGKFQPEYSSTLNKSYIVQEDKGTYSTDDAGILQPSTTSNKNSFAQEIYKKEKSFRKYEPILIQNLDVAEEVNCSPTYPVKVSNRIQVSEYGNPLTNPYDTSYRVGTSNNEIIALNAVALNLSDAKFGEFPLYVFTKEGIYAMQTGTETIYSNMIPIAKDVAINPHTLATSGAVFFFTEKGLHTISQEGINLISAGLHNKDGRIPEWMYTCKLIHLPEFNEVMCVLVDDEERTTGKAYVFSIGNKCWSERDVPIGYILNGHEVVGVSTIANLESEGDSVKSDILLETRPIKLGANKELKRLETLVVRFEADKKEPLQVTIKGSIDGVDYKDLRHIETTTNTDVLIRRTPASVKYLKFVVKSSNLQSSIRLIRFDTEHYLRFVRKMR